MRIIAGLSQWRNDGREALTAYLGLGGPKARQFQPTVGEDRTLAMMHRDQRLTGASPAGHPVKNDGP